jgi:predicted dehydrogenase
LLALDQRDIVFYRTNHSTLPTAELADFPVEYELDAALAHHPDAVIVANPTACHLQVAIPAARAGCHLLLEKPVSHSLARVDELAAAVEKSGVQVLVGFQYRFHPALQQLSRWLAGWRAASPGSEEPEVDLKALGPIGRPLSARATYGEYLPGWHPWEDYRAGYSARADLGGGVILTLCHPLDYLRWLLGEVKSAWAFAGRLNDLGLQVEDTAEIGLRFENDVLGSVHLDYNQCPAQHVLEVVGTRGTLRWNAADGALRVYTMPGSAAAKGPDDAWKILPAPMGFERNDMFLAEMRHFLALLSGEAQPICSLADGVMTLHLALAARCSAEKGEIVTRLGGQVCEKLARKY